ncbi:MAG: hypothetical protein ACYCXA_06575 [Actinomycetes bacterium]
MAVITLASGCATAPPVMSAPPLLHLVGGVGLPASVGAMGAPNLPVGMAGWVLVGTLPDQPRQARVRRWAADAASASGVVRLGDALGLTGRPVRHANGWMLSTPAGDLRVRDGSGAPWAYVRADVGSCPPFSVDIDHSGPGPSVGCAVATTPGAPVPAAGPDGTATRAAAAPLLATLGITGIGQVGIGAPASTLSVSPTVDGLPTVGEDTTVVVDAVGIRAATGRLQAPLASDTYPLRSARDAFDALVNGPRPMLARYCGPVPSSSVPVPEPTCPAPEPTRVTGARLGLMLAYDATGTGSYLLVPAWLFTVEGSVEPVPVIAVAPAYLTAPTTSMPGASGTSGAAATGSAGSPPLPAPEPPAPVASGGAPTS